VTQIAERLHVREFEPQIRPDFNRDDVIGMKVPLPIVMPLAQLLENLRHRRNTHSKAPVVQNCVRLPAALDATPFVAEKASKPGTSMVRAVTLLGGGAASLLKLAPVNRAAILIGQRRATRRRARPQRSERHFYFEAGSLGFNGLPSFILSPISAIFRLTVLASV